MRVPAIRRAEGPTYPRATTGSPAGPKAVRKSNAPGVGPSRSSCSRWRTPSMCVGIVSSELHHNTYCARTGFSIQSARFFNAPRCVPPPPIDVGQGGGQISPGRERLHDFVAVFVERWRGRAGDAQRRPRIVGDESGGRRAPYETGSLLSGLVGLRNRLTEALRRSLVKGAEKHGRGEQADLHGDAPLRKSRGGGSCLVWPNSCFDLDTASSQAAVTDDRDRRTTDFADSPPPAPAVARWSKHASPLRRDRHRSAHRRRSEGSDGASDQACCG
jgi:hypothetical protein